MTELRLEHMSVDELVGWKVHGNPKSHDLGIIISSMERFGFTVPIVVDEKQKRIADGHGRLDALLDFRRRKADPPGNVSVNDDGQWMVPVFRGGSWDNEAELRTFLVTVNRSVERGGWWDEARLLSEPPGTDVVERVVQGGQSLLQHHVSAIQDWKGLLLHG